MGLWLHRRHLVWVRQKGGNYFYFNVERWTFRRYRETWKREDFYGEKEIEARTRQLKVLP